MSGCGRSAGSECRRQRFDSDPLRGERLFRGARNKRQRNAGRRGRLRRTDHLVEDADRAELVVRVIVILVASLAARLNRGGLRLAARDSGEVRDGRRRAPRVVDVDVPEGHGELQEQREQRHPCRSPTLRPEPTHLRENPTGPHPCGEQQGGGVRNVTL